MRLHEAELKQPNPQPSNKGRATMLAYAREVAVNTHTNVTNSTTS
jgi:hypothetical protein